MTVGFAPVSTPNPPKCGTPPINPDTRKEMAENREALADALKDKAPVIAAIIKTPVGCDLPEQGGISGNSDKIGKKIPGVCYLA